MDRLEKIREMSGRDLAMLGIEDVAYIKAITVAGGTQYAVHSADGAEIAIVPNREIAFVAVRQHDLEPVSVH